MKTIMKTQNKCTVDSIELVCSPTEYLVIMSALKKLADDKDTPSDDRKIAHKLSLVIPICKEGK